MRRGFEEIGRKVSSLDSRKMATSSIEKKCEYRLRK